MAAADVLAVEDTRRLHRLANDLEVTLTGRVVSFHESVERARLPGLLAALADGATVLLLTDAGMPSVSDPGYTLVRAAIEAGVEVTSVPGPSAVTTALAGSGLPCDRFCFEGFLPRKAGERRSRLAGLADERRTMVFFESPHRLADALADAAEAFGADRAAAVCRELTKTHEEIRRGPLASLAEWAAEGVRGEITLVVSGASAAPVPLTAGAGRRGRRGGGGGGDPQGRHPRRRRPDRPAAPHRLRRRRHRQGTLATRRGNGSFTCIFGSTTQVELPLPLVRSADAQLVHPCAVDGEHLGPHAHGIFQHVGVGEAQDDPAHGRHLSVPLEVQAPVFRGGVVPGAVELDREHHFRPRAVQPDRLRRQLDAVLAHTRRQRPVTEHVEDAVRLELAPHTVCDEVDGLAQEPPPGHVWPFGEGLVELQGCHQSAVGEIEGERTTFRPREQRPRVDDGAVEPGHPQALAQHALRRLRVERLSPVHDQVGSAGPTDALVDRQVQWPVELVHAP